MKLLSLLCLSILCPYTLFADVLVSFAPLGFTQGGPSPWADEGDSTQVQTAGGVEIIEGLQRGPGVRPGGTADAWGGNGFDGAERYDAENQGAWFLVTLAPENGRAISYSSLHAVIFRSGESASSYQWQYRPDADSDFVDLGESITLEEESMKGIEQVPIDLSTIPALQNTSEPVAFRLLGWGASGRNASWGFGKTNGQPVLWIEGSVENE